VAGAHAGWPAGCLAPRASGEACVDRSLVWVVRLVLAAVLQAKVAVLVALLGTTVGAGADTTSQNCGGIGQDVVYQVDRQGVGALKVDVSVPLTNYNTSIYARSVCNSQNSELACQNLNGNSAAETFTLPNVNATVFVYVDGSAMGGGQNFGTYGIVLTP
jgi:hypothetical protein